MGHPLTPYCTLLAGGKQEQADTQFQRPPLCSSFPFFLPLSGALEKYPQYHFPHFCSLSPSLLPLSGALERHPEGPWILEGHNVGIPLARGKQEQADTRCQFPPVCSLFPFFPPSSGALERYPEAPGFWKGTTWGYHYAALPRILRRFPEAEGVLWTNDDVVINYWNFLGANKSKLWLPNNKNKLEYSFYNLFANGTAHARTDWPAGSVYRKQAQEALFSLPPKYEQQYFKSTHGMAVYHKRVCDLFFVPRRHFAAFEVLIPKVFKAGLISELAIPMAFLAMEAPEEWDPILDEMEYNWELMWRTNLSYNPRDHWRPGLPAYHPWKVKTEEGKKQLLRAIAAADPAIEPVFPSYVRLTWREWFEEWSAYVHGELRRVQKIFERD